MHPRFDSAEFHGLAKAVEVLIDYAQIKRSCWGIMWAVSSTFSSAHSSTSHYVSKRNNLLFLSIHLFIWILKIVSD